MSYKIQRTPASFTEMMRAGEGGIAALVESIQEPFRGLEIIQPLKNGKAILLTKSKIAPWTAEWVADIVASVLPAATLDEIIWQYPATLVFHLVAAAARKSGGSTRRPESRESIMDALQKLASTGADNTLPPIPSNTEA